MDTRIKIEKQKHWAATLRQNDNVIATIRHKSNGNKNLIDVLCKVITNDQENEKIELAYLRSVYMIKYNDLTDINKLTNNYEK